MYSDVKGGSRYGDQVGCQWLLPPLSVAPSRSDTGGPVYATFLEGTDVFEHEPIKGVDLNVLQSRNEVHLKSVLLCKLECSMWRKWSLLYIDVQKVNMSIGESPGDAQERRWVVYPRDRWARSGIPDLTSGEPGLGVPGVRESPACTYNCILWNTRLTRDFDFD